MRPALASLPPGHDSTHGRRQFLAVFGLALVLTGPLACAHGPSTSAPARRNAAERPPPFTFAPELRVADATGTVRDLASLMGPKGLVLVLYRGHW